jgi:signal transduction histidine kinase
MPPDTSTAVIFYSDIYRRRAIEQYNINTLSINSVYLFDFDNNGCKDAAVTYVNRDSAWLEIVDIEKGSIYREFIASGVDRDGNGYWDGGASICAAFDFDDDGYAEILVGVDTGYDLYPRRLCCLNWRYSKMLWQYDYAGTINKYYFFVGALDESEEPVLVFGLNSKGNLAVERDMDDKHSYLMVLDKHGVEMWKEPTGGIFTTGMQILIDFDRDGARDILAGFVYHDSGNGAGSERTEGGRLCVFSRTGELLHSLDMGPGRAVRSISLFDLDMDGNDEIFLSLLDKSVIICDQFLNPIKKCRLYSMGQIWDCRDFLGLGVNQFLISTADKKLLLTDQDFNPLAQLEGEEAFSYGEYVSSHTPAGQEVNHIVLNSSSLTIKGLYGFEKSPWYTVFSRNPILAFLAGAVPLSLITGIIWLVLAKFRQKNKIISSQRDKLNRALIELKRAQEKLIAAEKYKQAKDIAGGVAHEIHNALYPALGSLDKLRRLLNGGVANGSDRFNRLMQLIETSVKRANAMTELVTEYSKLESEKEHEAVSMAPLLEEIIDENKYRIDSVRAEVEIQIPEGCKIKCSRAHAFSLFNNLMINALDALAEKEGGAISVSAESLNERIRFEFSDSGSGIPPENVPRIFDAFFSTKPSTGTGLGLAMTKRIVELYDGRIEVKSFLDRGTEFTILLPSA